MIPLFVISAALLSHLTHEQGPEAADHTDQFQPLESPALSVHRGPGICSPWMSDELVGKRFAGPDHPNLMIREAAVRPR